MSINIVQSNPGGSISSSGGGNAATNFTTSSAGFNSPTVGGNILLFLAFSSAHATAGTVIPNTNPIPSPPAMPGVTWVPLSVDKWVTNSFVDSGVIGSWHAAPAGSIPTSATASVTVQFVGGSPSDTYNAQVEFVLYEISGAALDNFVDNSVTHTATVTAGNLPTSQNNDLILVWWGGIGSAIPAGTGYTLGTGPVVVAPAQVEFQFNVGPAGTYAASFGGTSGTWAAEALSLKSTGVSTPILVVSPLVLNYSVQQYGPNPTSQNFAISNGDGGTLNWVIASDSSWLTPSVASGTGNASVAANVNVAGLGPGSYVGHLTVTAAGATGSPQVVTVNLQILGSTGGGGGGTGGGSTPCVLNYANGVLSPDLSLYIQPFTALYTQPVPTTAIKANESVAQGRNAIILDFNNTEGIYARDLGVEFTWPITSGTILDLWAPTVIPEQDDLYNRLSYHFLINALGLTGWGHIRELNIAHNAVSDITLLLTFDQWPNITLTIPNSGGQTTKVKVILPPNKFKMVEGWLSSAQPFMLWGESCVMKLGEWGRTDSYKIIKPFSG